jgi:hypothetical protein
MIYKEIREQNDHTLYFELKLSHRIMLNKNVFKILHEIPITEIETLCGSLLVPWTEFPLYHMILHEIYRSMR